MTERVHRCDHCGERASARIRDTRGRGLETRIICRALELALDAGAPFEVVERWNLIAYPTTPPPITAADKPMYSWVHASGTRARRRIG